MQQLLQITTTPIEMKYVVENPRLEYNQAPNPSAKITQRPTTINMQSRDIRVQIDSTDMRRSLGYVTPSDLAKQAARKGQDNFQKFVAEQYQFGDAVSQIQNGVTISDVMRQKLTQLPTSYTAFLPSVGPKISWDPGQLTMQAQPGELNTDWNIAKNNMEFVPGKFHMNIVRYPKVTVKYVGGPNYCPPSADPRYVAPAE